MDPSDSLIIFSMAPGEQAWLASCGDRTYEGMTTGTHAYRIMNLAWLRITRGDENSTYSPQELIRFLREKKLHKTVLVIE